MLLGTNLVPPYHYVAKQASSSGYAEKKVRIKYEDSVQAVADLFKNNKKDANHAFSLDYAFQGPLSCSTVIAADKMTPRTLAVLALGDSYYEIFDKNGKIKMTEIEEEDPNITPLFQEKYEQIDKKSKKFKAIGLIIPKQYDKNKMAEVLDLVHLELLEHLEDRPVHTIKTSVKKTEDDKPFTLPDLLKQTKNTELAEKVDLNAFFKHTILDTVKSHTTFMFFGWEDNTYSITSRAGAPPKCNPTTPNNMHVNQAIKANFIGNADAKKEPWFLLNKTFAASLRLGEMLDLVRHEVKKLPEATNS